MSLVFAGICSHAPGITGRASMADAALREPFYAAFRGLREQLIAARPQALIVVAAEHFALCSDTTCQGAGSVSQYAQGLTAATRWSSWQDQALPRNSERQPTMTSPGKRAAGRAQPPIGAPALIVLTARSGAHSRAICGRPAIRSAQSLAARNRSAPFQVEAGWPAITFRDGTGAGSQAREARHSRDTVPRATSKARSVTSDTVRRYPVARGGLLACPMTR